jgi:6-phosphofructokinase 2
VPETRIVTLTMNPAVDIATDVDRIEPAHKLRCGPPRWDAGGGGINVARAVLRLGGSPTAIFPSGGAIGAVLETLVRTEDLDFRSIPIAGETRQDFAVRETSTGDQYRFVLPGPDLNAREAQACVEAILEIVRAPAILVASGSLPPNLSSNFYAEVARVVAACNARFVLDCSGAALKSALASGLHLIKPSRRELCELTGETLPDRDACLAACRSIVRERACELVALSLGDEGALLVGKDFALSATAPKVKPLSSVGAGDSFLGALVLELARGTPPAEALRKAVAAGSAALLSPGTGLFDAADVEKLYPQVIVSEV